MVIYGGIDMGNAIKSSLITYRIYFKEVVLIGFLFTLPLQVAFTFFINYVTAPFQFFGNQLWTSLIQLFFILILFPMIQLPYISLVKYDMLEDGVSLSTVFNDFFKNSFHVYLLSIICSVLSTIGLIFFIIPGLILMLFFLCLPQAVLINNKKWFGALKRSMQLGRKKVLSLSALIVMFLFIDSLISGLLFFLGVGLTNSFFIVNIILLIVNTFLIPIFIFAISYIYISREIEKKGDHLFIKELTMQGSF